MFYEINFENLVAVTLSHCFFIVCFNYTYSCCSLMRRYTCFFYDFTMLCIYLSCMHSVYTFMYIMYIYMYFVFRHRLSAGTNEKIQLSGMIAAFQLARDPLIASMDTN